MRRCPTTIATAVTTSAAYRRPLHRRLSILLGVTLLSGFGSAYAQAPQWPNTYISQLQALALMQTLNANILSSTSATLTLEKWCGDHGLAKEAKVTAKLDPLRHQAASAETRKRLQVSDAELVKYRRVQLSCGALVLSEADNWYVPSRLTPDMNRELETKNTSFGRVVLPLKPFRQTYAAALLWSPLPPLWETGAARPPLASGPYLAIPAQLFTHSAVLYSDQIPAFAGKLTPFSLVVETYQSTILAFKPPPP